MEHYVTLAADIIRPELAIGDSNRFRFNTIVII